MHTGNGPGTMQNGYDPGARHLGTPIEPKLREAIQRAPPCLSENDHATKVMKALWLSPDLGFSERDALFVRAPTVLQGMNLTNPPTGGFTTAARSVVVGAGPGGAEFNTRLSSTMFLQPGNPNKRMEVGPPDAVKVSEDFPPFRTPDGKLRSPHGHMTVARVDQEAAINADLAAAARDAFDPPLDPEPSPAYSMPASTSARAQSLGPSAGTGTNANTGTGLHLHLRPDEGASSQSASQALQVLEQTLDQQHLEDGSSSSATIRRNSAPGLSHDSTSGSFADKLTSWWRAFVVAPVQPSTWSHNDQWVPITVIVMAFIVLVLLCVILTQRKSV
jgi:hypothetical protein